MPHSDHIDRWQREREGTPDPTTPAEQIERMRELLDNAENRQKETEEMKELGWIEGQAAATEWLSIDAASVGPHAWCLECDSLLLLTDWEDHQPIWAHERPGCNDPVPDFWPEPGIDKPEAYVTKFRQAVEMTIKEGRDTFEVIP